MTHRTDLNANTNFIDLLGVRNRSYRPVIFPEFTGDQDNLNLGPGTLFYVTSSAPVSITGILESFNGRELIIYNVGLQNIAFLNNSTSSALRNRIVTGTGTDVVLSPNGILRFYYGEDIGRWRTTAKEAAPGPGPGSFLDTLNNVQEDVAGNLDLAPAPSYENLLKVAAHPSLDNTVAIEPPDWHSFTLPTITLAPPTPPATASVVLFGLLKVPTGKVVNKVRMGIRNVVTDAADATIEVSVVREDPPGTAAEELISSDEYPTDKAFATTAEEGERLVVAAKNAAAGSKTLIAQVQILLENA